EIGPEAGTGADCVVTGEAFVLLDLLHTILADQQAGWTARDAFEQARLAGRLNDVPGLVYLSPDSCADEPVAVNTGVQHLLRDLDEYPLPDAGYRSIEPPHHRRTLAAQPCAPKRVGRLSPIASVIATQGCRFNCPYCPIPAVNQRTWRHKSAQRFAAEMKHIHENFGIRGFFGTDDNFFNDRASVESLMSELGRTTTDGVPLGQRIKFYTEGTQADVYKNRDLLPMCRNAGLRGIWFGIEDLTGKLVKKGQSADRTEQLFSLMNKLGIQPHAMMIHSDAQPLRSAPNDLSGLLNQARYILKQGAVSYQCTYLGPAIGTRDLEPALTSGAVYRHVGGKPVPNAFQDGNHVVASRHPYPWRQQLNLLRAYFTFYNPVNTIRALLGIRKNPVSPRQLVYQLVGQIGLLLTIPRMLAWARRLKLGPIEPYDGLATARIPMIDAATGNEINWAIEHIPSGRLRQRVGDRKVHNAMFTAADLAARLGGTIEGDGSIEIRTVATLDQATPDSISWVGDRRYVASVNGSKAGVILMGTDYPPLLGRTIIKVTDPDVALLHVLKWLSPPRCDLKTGVDPSARVHPSATVTGASIGANVVVDADAIVGAGTALHHGVHVGAMTRIGSDCELWPNVVVRERVTIGDRVTIHPNTTIGSDGFGYLQRNGKHLKIPQIGTVMIEDDVEIGANCAIDRARTGVTRIGQSTKIDNLVQIAHNVDIGSGCIIVAQCGIAGSTTLGDYAMLGGQVGLSDHLRIGSGARVAAKSAVFKDIAPDETARGIPATSSADFLRHEAGVRRLPKWVDELKALRDRVQELERLLTPEASTTHTACSCAASESDHGFTNCKRGGVRRSALHGDRAASPS
ncbi:MAG: UDP-3-O-(3-hydroxymyristoyl)glucosamine N-acyltransferase, partial [Phycisphaerae bacterium]|nr:UDP-3-O-(3-hydroxymyristoyl)glucosamine N-acyltransferase [Phycisphaerae bacterium]